MNEYAPRSSLPRHLIIKGSCLFR